MNWSNAIIHGLQYVILTIIRFHKKARSTLSTECVLRVEQAFFFVQANTCIIVVSTQKIWP